MINYVRKPYASDADLIRRKFKLYGTDETFNFLLASSEYNSNEMDTLRSQINDQTIGSGGFIPSVYFAFQNVGAIVYEVTTTDIVDARLVGDIGVMWSAIDNNATGRYIPAMFRQIGTNTIQLDTPVTGDYLAARTSLVFTNQETGVSVTLPVSMAQKTEPSNLLKFPAQDYPKSIVNVLYSQISNQPAIYGSIDLNGDGVYSWTLVGTLTQGPKGDKGDRGQTGLQGEQGIRGLQGETGSRGPTGPQGPIGPQGVIGPQGPTGLQGVTGPTGPQGTTGPEGPEGPEGPQGPTGPQGVQGTAGASNITYRGQVATYLELSSVTPSPSLGDMWEVTADKLFYIYGAMGFPQDGQGVNIQGVQGPIGPQGAIGPTGPTGPQGAQGDRGATGPQGAQGNTGPTGPQGSQGETGPQGNDGPSPIVVPVFYRESGQPTGTWIIEIDNWTGDYNTVTASNFVIYAIADGSTSNPTSVTHLTGNRFRIVIDEPDGDFGIYVTI